MTGLGRGKNFPIQKAYFQRVKPNVKKRVKKRVLKVLINGIKSLLLHPQQRISSLHPGKQTK